MKNKGSEKEILEQLSKGVSREELNIRYPKSVVTRVYNRYINGCKASEEERILELFREIFKIVDNNANIEINIKVTPKKCSINKKEEESIINPYELYYQNDKEELSRIFESKDNDYLFKIIKEFLPDSTRKIYKEKNKEKLIEYIIKSMDKLTSIGKSFKES